MAQLTQEEFNKKFDRLYTFLETRVALREDIVLLKEDIALLEEKIPSKELIHRLYNAADALTKEVKDYRQEQSATAHRQEKVETWIRAVAPKVSVKFEQ